MTTTFEPEKQIKESFDLFLRRINRKEASNEYLFESFLYDLEQSYLKTDLPISSYERWYNKAKSVVE